MMKHAKGYFGLMVIISIFSQNLWAYNTNSMKKNYHEAVRLPDTILKPLIEDKKITKIKTTVAYQPQYLGMDAIYVKENIDNLGKYRWNKKSKTYINALNHRALKFKKNHIYLISKVQYAKISQLDDALKTIGKKNISAQKLKDLFENYNNRDITKRNLSFYHELVQTLLADRLIWLKNREYLFIVDKKTQRAYIFTFQKSLDTIEFIGSDKISTGNPRYNSRNNRYFETPIGIINRAKYRRGDWRAVSKNAFKYGEKSDRVYYLGTYTIPIAYQSKFKREVHLAIHSTTPIDAMLLGHKVSKGCIRISRHLNKILNKSALLDGKNGKYVIIIDSSLPMAENIRQMMLFSSKSLKNRSKKYAMHFY
ncbi:L,D-transpeptidase [Sulfurospirillum sp. 1612]|uniref:L,D-transpeptidase n=1 Tax=Sulfurospirillum sp. 1612 TaxID=3094835 RepID=UPI002F953565